MLANVSKRNINKELYIAALIAIAFYAFFVITDFMEFWVELTREYEKYELDELLGLVLGMTLGLLYLSVKLIKYYKSDRKRIYRLAKELDFQANYDQLTKIPNRIAFRKDTRTLISDSSKLGGQFTLFYIDLDSFKYINDMLGYGIGDQLLVSVANRLQVAMANNATLFRIGGDEFCIIQPGFTDEKKCLLICNQLNDSISQPFNINNHKLHISQTIGISRYPEDGESYEQLLTVADIAMYMGKKPGQSQSNFKDSDFIEKMKRRFIVQHGLNDALNNHEFFVVYQPKVELGSGKVSGAEALVRWKHPAHGLINPDEFIGVAEELHTVHLIDLYVLETVCKQIKEWGNIAQPIAVNFSPMLFSDECFAESVFSLLSEYQVSPNLIKLEITERTIAVDSEIPLLVCNKISDAGIAISLDDFGAGYSSLSHMTEYPISELKIDRSFTIRICDNQNTKNTVSAIIGLAKASEISIVAEGVETQEQYDLFKQLGCSQVQGYFIDRPLSAEDYTKQLKTVT